MTLRAAIYARKSTDQSDVQDADKSVHRQVLAAHAFITTKGWSLDDDEIGTKPVKQSNGTVENEPVHRHVFVDDAVSGALFTHRPDFQRMMRAAEARAFDALVVFDLDRLGRDGEKTMDTLRSLTDLGVTVYDATTGEASKLNSGVMDRLPTLLRTEFAEMYRELVRKHVRAAMHGKAQSGYALGGKVFGYVNHRISKGHAEHRIHPTEAAVVVEIYERFASGDGLRSIAAKLNARKLPSPRAQQGRPRGWSASTVKAILARDAYRGIYTYGRMKKAFHRELGITRAHREKGMIPAPPENLTQSAEWADRLRIVPPELADRVDARRAEWRRRTTPGKTPQKAHGKYLLSGGLLTCPDCGAHFEARIAPWKGHRSVYVCATRRRKPGCCANTLALPIETTDDDVLSIVEGHVLGTAMIEELLALVDHGEVDQTARLAADRDRVKGEIINLVGSIAAGVPAATVAGAIREREASVARIEADLRRPRPARTNIETLRSALTQQAADWKAQLRAEPRVARLLLRRLVGPMTLWLEAAGTAATEEVRWEAEATLALLDACRPTVASPMRLTQAVTPRRIGGPLRPDVAA